ncbi:AAA family ATPase [Victivallis vadensis]|uniref:AAA family ATPase n=1 Tax=Victivallis vadensis TaxID=172901 RepID=UPI00307F5CFD
MRRNPLRQQRHNVFYVFSSNAAPFEANKAYSAFNVYAMLEHGGDFTQAAKTLLEHGYGTPVAVDSGVDLSGFMTAATPPKDEQLLSLAELEERYPKLRPPIIHGLLREGETMNIIAAPKTGKSWLVLDLALAVAAGRDWLGFPCESGKVLLIDNELHPETSASRIRKVRDARGAALTRIGERIFIDNQRGRLKDIYELGRGVEMLKKHQFKLVIIDAFYRAMPMKMDENDNGGMAKLYNAIDRYAKELDCAFVLIHHTSKGNQSIKNVTDVGSGAGAQSRAADAHLILRRHKDEDIVVLESVVRSFQPNPPVCLRWNYPLWDVDLSIDPKALDGVVEEMPKRKKADVGELAVMIAELVPDNGIPKTQLITKAQAQLELSREKSRNAIAVGIELGLLSEAEETDPDNRQRMFKNITRCD